MERIPFEFGLGIFLGLVATILWVIVALMALLNRDWRVEVYLNKYHEGWAELFMFFGIVGYLLWLSYRLFTQ